MTEERKIDRSDNLPPDMDILPVLPPTLDEEEIAAKLAARDVETPPTDVELPYDDAARFALKLAITRFAEAAGKWKDIGEISTEAQAERCNDFIAGATGLLQKTEKQRKADKAIHDAHGKAVQVAYEPLTSVLERINDLIGPMRSKWLVKKQARLDAEREAARAAAAKAKADADALAERARAANDVIGMAEADRLKKDAAKATKVADREVRAQVGSATGGARTTGLRTQAYAEVENWNAVYMQFREHERVREVLQSLSDAAVRGGNEVNGAVRRERKL